MTQIKICGITNLADARYASGANANFLGFVQDPLSQRYVTPDKARDIINWVYGARTVGVFVNEEADEVNRIADLAGFDFVQLHGEESAGYCEWIDRPIIKAIRVEPEIKSSVLARRAREYAEIAEYILFDTAVANMPGGTGQLFDWSILEHISTDLPFFLAGGLTPENAALAINAVHPFGLDVSSGVEDAPGQKDFDRIDAFMAAAIGDSES